MANNLGEVLREALARKWAEDDAAHKQMEMEQSVPDKTPINLSRATFAEIKNNPAQRTQISHALVLRGYKYKSVASIITQMIRQKMAVVGDDGVLRAAVDKYVPLKTSSKFKAEAKRPVSSSVKAGLVAIAPVVANDIDHILNTLPIKQAHALYVELRKIFGDTK